jgi:hypothetical protein
MQARLMQIRDGNAERRLEQKMHATKGKALAYGLRALLVLVAVGTV